MLLYLHVGSLDVTLYHDCSTTLTKSLSSPLLRCHTPLGMIIPPAKPAAAQALIYPCYCQRPLVAENAALPCYHLPPPLPAFLRDPLSNGTYPYDNHFPSCHTFNPPLSWSSTMRVAATPTPVLIWTLRLRESFFLCEGRNVLTNLIGIL